MKRSGSSASPTKKPTVLVVGGFEPTGRVGVLADAGAIEQSGANAAVVPSAWTAQGKTFLLEPMPMPAFRASVKSVFDVRGKDVKAVKLGMMATRAQWRWLWRFLDETCPKIPVVVDPVVFSSRGERLSELEPRDFQWAKPGRVFLTPNAQEVVWLASASASTKARREVMRVFEGPVERGTAEAAARGSMRTLKLQGLLLKGGHLEGEVRDLVLQRGKDPTWDLRPSMKKDPNRHRGTGCRLASALAAGLAQGDDFATASRRAAARVQEYLATEAWWRR